MSAQLADHAHATQLPTTGQVTEEVVSMLAHRQRSLFLDGRPVQTDDELRQLLGSLLGTLSDASKEDVVFGIWIALEEIGQKTGLTLLQSLRQVGCKDEIDEQLVTDASLEHLRTVLALLGGLRDVVHAVAEHEPPKSEIVASLRFGGQGKRAIDLIRQGRPEDAIVIALAYPPVFLDQPMASARED